MPFHHKIDVAWKVLILTFAVSALWWAATMNADMRAVTLAVRPIPQMVTDIALIRQSLTNKTLSQQ